MNSGKRNPEFLTRSNYIGSQPVLKAKGMTDKMSNLLPLHAVDQVSRGLSEYLTTNFSLASEPTAEQLRQFLLDPKNGMFYGPYVRTRLPYTPATDWDGLLSWLPDFFKPYYHQAEAFRRLRSIDDKGVTRRPQPTLVVTGTGSGKTESFLYPILDHCMRARAAGQNDGVKAVILYPMNALATDQAQRLAKLLTSDPALGAITAGIYTGDKSLGGRTRVTNDGLITDREAMRDVPPDILLTNYKMLDQLLLREADKKIWEKSAHTLQYLVLDEFHTYDAAQGADVALLLRRLGLAIKRSQKLGFLEEEYESLPLGRITPVATSATLGGGPRSDGSEQILDFAYTVFGEKLEKDAIVGEKILTIDEWQQTVEPLTGVPLPQPTAIPSAQLIREILDSVFSAPEAEETYEHAVHRVLCKNLFDCDPASIRTTISAMATNEVVTRILAAAQSPVPLLYDEELPGSRGVISSLVNKVFVDSPVQRRLGNQAAEFISIVLSEMAFLRAAFGEETGWDGKKIPGVETHLWVREISRIDRVVGDSSDGMFRWSDDGVIHNGADLAYGESAHMWLPAIYCRHCGRSGWMIAVQPGDSQSGCNLETSVQKIRQTSIDGPERVRPLLDASSEVAAGGTNKDSSSKVAWLDLNMPLISSKTPDDEAIERGAVIPVLMYAGDDVEERAEAQECPSCNETDSIRYLGSSVSTLLSVALSNLFSMGDLDGKEKKTLVFADSVQDAAHRAGFVQDRARTFAVRGQINNAVRSIIRESTSEKVALSEIADRMVENAESIHNKLHARQALFDLLPPEIAHSPNYRSVWDSGVTKKDRARGLSLLASRLNMDLVLQFGERVDLPRSLVNTGTLTVAVDVTDNELASIALSAFKGIDFDPKASVRWVRGLLEYMRIDGGIYHPWMKSYLRDDCNAYLLNRREARVLGVPPFTKGGAPMFPRTGPRLKGAKKKTANNSVRSISSQQGWYARWTARAFASGEGTFKASEMVTVLFKELAKTGILGSISTNTNGVVYYLAPERIRVSWEEDPKILKCTSCSMRVGVDAKARAELINARCFHLNCDGHYEVEDVLENYYNKLYQSSNLRSVVAEEHTSLIPPKKRAKIEAQFKGTEGTLAADSPNVLVATPTLEMGIDIGDLSTVMLASLPDTVASYVQRVGRAGRLTGNSLVLATIRGRGRALTKLEHPLETIAGSVTAPASYLSAREIIHRQFLAYLVDTHSFAPTLGNVRNAQDVFADKTGGAAAVLIDIVRSGIETELDQFCSTLRVHTDERALKELRRWATSETGLISAIASAQTAWHNQYFEALHREAKLQKEADELEKRKGNTGSTSGEGFINDPELEEQSRALTSSLRAVNKELKDLKSEHWIAAMERYGLLPNFTLLDDSVDFRLAVSNFDIQTSQFSTSSFNYSRGVSSALKELAPGNTFYVEKIAAVIDTIDLGREMSNMKQWRVCPACSYVEEEIDNKTAHSCPACGSPKFKDRAQLIDVVEMRRVSATVDGTKPSVRSFDDERRSTHYQVHMSFSIPRGGEGPAWFLENSGFGMQYLPVVTMRWMNLGNFGQGARVELAGREIQAPKFRVCEYCGHIDSTAGQNSWRDHNPWCTHKNEFDEHSKEVALGRTLTTQGVIVYIPSELSSLENTTLPSLLAALKMGFKMYLGGNPDHLDIEAVKVSTSKVSDSNSSVSDALLIHDKVPGGTGYLAQFTDYDQVRDMLKVAYEHLVGCSCATEDRKACPSCLLPYAPSSQAQDISREAAVAALYKILVDDLYCDVKDEMPSTTWDDRITEKMPVRSDRSKLEEKAIEQLRLDLKREGAQVTETIRENHAYWTIKFPGSPHTWTLREQVMVGPTVPDLLLETLDPEIRPIAIYLDGQAFHASRANLRVADDFAKRNYLYQDGFLPMSITWRDVEHRQVIVEGVAVDPPAWQNKDKGTEYEIMQHLGLSKALGALLSSDPLTLLLTMLKHPQEDWNALSTLAFSEAVTNNGQPTADGIEAQYFGDILVKFTLDEKPVLEYSLPDGEVNEEAWRTFLTLSNFAYLRRFGSTVRIYEEGSKVNSDDFPASQTTTVPTHESHLEESSEQSIPPEWQEVLNEFADEPDVIPSLKGLVELDLPAPDANMLGSDIKGVPIITGWNAYKLLLAFPGDGEELSSAIDGSGYTVVEANFEPECVPDSVTSVLSSN